LERKRRQDIIREVIDKDTEQGEATEKIKPEVALHGQSTACSGHQINPKKPRHADLLYNLARLAGITS
jgi:hypothetical protein